MIQNPGEKNGGFYPVKPAKESKKSQSRHAPAQAFAELVFNASHWR
jgi:hypothetical protein